jgi:hypothetical protein
VNKDIKENSKENMTTPEEIRKKQARVNIDFEKDNILPELNKEDLEELNKPSKPVLLKKSIIDRNIAIHPELKKDDYNIIIRKSLYEPNLIFSGHNKNYTNFISKLHDTVNSTVLIELSESKSNYEIVHIHKIYDKNLKSMIRRDNE